MGKDNVLMFRANDDQRAALYDAADACDMAFADWAREILLRAVGSADLLREANEEILDGQVKRAKAAHKRASK